MTFLYDMSTNNPVVKVEGRRPETLTTGLFVLSIPGMATWQTYKPSLIKFEPWLTQETQKHVYPSKISEIVDL